MKVILKQDLPQLGKKGELKDVAEGYARNMLIPRVLAVEATTQLLRDLQRRETDEQKKIQRQQSDSKNMALQLEQRVFTLKMLSGEGGRLFGSVTAADIAAILQQEGFTVDKKKISLDGPIKQIGSYQMTIKLTQGVKATICLNVEKGS